MASGHKIFSSSDNNEMERIPQGRDLLQAKLLLLSAEFGSYDFERLLPAALAVELFDLAFKRRYYSPLTNFSLIIGDFYYAKAISLVTFLDDVGVVNILAQTIASFARGNSEDLEEFERRSELATLYRTSCWLGALIGKVDEKIVETLKSFGLNFGIFYEVGGISGNVIETCKNVAIESLEDLPGCPTSEQFKLLISKG